jgi:hypothetical protein
MKQLALVLVGCTALYACSGSREQRAPVNHRMAQRPDLTLPATAPRIDTSVTLSSRSEPPVAVEEPKVPAASPAKKKPASVRHRVRPATPAPKKQVEDSTVQGYAPTPPRDTARETAGDTATRRDSTSALATVGTSKIRSDTTATQPDSGISPMETSADSTVTSRAETAVAPPPSDTTKSPAADSTNRRPRDSARTADSLPPKPPADTNTAPAASPPPPAAAANAPAASRTLPAGTAIHAALDDSITSRRDTVGQQISAHVMENVLGPDGRTLIAAGTPVRFTITRIRPSRSKSSQGRLSLRPDGIALSGQLRAVQASVRPVPRELRGRGITGSEAAKVGGGAAAGAVIGGAVGKTKGAVIGGVAGAAAGAAVASQTATRDVVVKAKTPVVLVLTAPLVAP